MTASQRSLGRATLVRVGTMEGELMRRLNGAVQRNERLPRVARRGNQCGVCGGVSLWVFPDLGGDVMKGREAFDALIEAYETLAIECGRRSDSLLKLMEERGELRAQLAAVTAERDELRAQRDQLRAQLDNDWQPLYGAAELRAQQATATAEPSGDSGQLAKAYQWQVGDEIRRAGGPAIRVRSTPNGKVYLTGDTWDYTQESLERTGWGLHRKAEQIAAEKQPNVGTDVEGQS